MDEIEPGAVRDAGQQARFATLDDLVPAHVGNRMSRRALQQINATGKHAQAGCVILARAVVEQLHPQADTEHRLKSGAESVL